MDLVILDWEGRNLNCKDVGNIANQRLPRLFRGVLNVNGLSSCIFVFIVPPYHYILLSHLMVEIYLQVTRAHICKHKITAKLK